MFRLALVLALWTAAAAQEETLSSAQLFASWKSEHNKKYDSDELHEEKYQIWLENDGAC